jgi:hypothetical protein
LRSLGVAVLCLVVVSACSASGFYAARAVAPTAKELAVAGESARVSSRAAARRAAYSKAVSEGRRAGGREGRASGTRAGVRAGARNASAVVAARRRRAAEAAAASAAARERAARVEINDRAANCGAALFVDGYCPTDAEVQTENDAESLCGPGTVAGREEAARKGISC